MVFLNGINVTKEVDISDGTNIVFPNPPADGDEIFYIFYSNVTQYKEVLTYVDVDSNYTTNDLEYLFVDTTNGALTITLPATPANGTRIKILDVKGNFDVNNVTLDGNGHNVMGATTMTLDVENKEYTVIYYGTGGEWRVC
jgi:hypothetical protein